MNIKNNLEILKEIISQQQEEKRTLLSNKYHPREITKSFHSQVKHNIVKAIMGPRRSGKSTFALHALKEKVKEEHFTYINFDSRELLNLGFTSQELLRTVKDFENKYLFLDEIQNLSSFELIINTLQRNGYNLTISGSNSNLIGGELSTHLTGRFLKFEILPFSLKAIARFFT